MDHIGPTTTAETRADISVRLEGGDRRAFNPCSHTRRAYGAQYSDCSGTGRTRVNPRPTESATLAGRRFSAFGTTAYVAGDLETFRTRASEAPHRVIRYRRLSHLPYATVADATNATSTAADSAHFIRCQRNMVIKE